MKILTVFGTRPEAVKMCPLVIALSEAFGEDSKLCVTGQHREMLDQVLDFFGIIPDYDLQIMKPTQTLTSITTSVLEGMEAVLEEAQPDVVLVHGDTSTSMSAAMAAFYKKIPVGHVEAGLRTYNRYSPFPEEMNRKLITALSTYFFAPTEQNRDALAKEDIHDKVYVTGNTGIDSFKYTIKEEYVFDNDYLNVHDFSEPTVLVTAHRRENFGRPLHNICEAINTLSRQYPKLRFIYPVHLNPIVRDTVFPLLGDNEQVLLIDPIDVVDMHNAMKHSVLVLTDSGGLQEEAPHLGKPVVVLRTETERPEAVHAGTAVVAGVETEDIVHIVSEILDDKTVYERMSKATNPYGDGYASERIVDALIREFSPEK